MLYAKLGISSWFMIDFPDIIPIAISFKYLARNPAKVNQKKNQKLILNAVSML